jgi:Flp pilus assembly protein TadG
MQLLRKTSSNSHRHQTSSYSRLGATTVEFAVVAPVFFAFMFAMVEFGHVYMVKNVVRGAAKKAARYGAADGITTAQVTAEAQRIINAGFKQAKATVDVKDASVFDSASVDASKITYGSLPAIELNGAKPRQLYIVRITVPYSSVALLPPVWAKNITISSQSVMRHE